MKKVIKPIPIILFSSLLVSCFHGPEYHNEEKMKSYYYSPDYVFCSEKKSFSTDGIYDIENSIINKIKEDGFKNAKINNLGQLQIDNYFYLLFDAKTKNNYYLYVFKLNPSTNELTVEETINTYDILTNEKGLKDVTIGQCSSSMFQISKEEIRIDIKYNSYYTDKFAIIYNVITNGIRFATKNDFFNYHPLLELEYRPISHIKILDEDIPDDYIEIVGENYSWEIKEDTLLQDSNFKLIREEVYPENNLNLNYHFNNDEIFIIASYVHPGKKFFVDNSKDTVTMVFKADVETKTISYLGFLSLYNEVKGIFKRNT